MTNTVTVLAESTGFSAVNTIWVLLGAALVFFMQAGFAMVETGFTRAKNAGNIINSAVLALWFRSNVWRRKVHRSL